MERDWILLSAGTFRVVFAGQWQRVARLRFANSPVKFKYQRTAVQLSEAYKLQRLVQIPSSSVTFIAYEPDR